MFGGFSKISMSSIFDADSQDGTVSRHGYLLKEERPCHVLRFYIMRYYSFPRLYSKVY